MTVAFPKVVLVDENDVEIGVADKLEAHEKGLLHRALSVLVYREGENGVEVLLQRRNKAKYHSGGLWANTCCTHPQPGADSLAESLRSLAFEMGIEGVALEPQGTFIYKADFENGLTEYELDHLFTGKYEGQTIAPNPDEVSEYAWFNFNDLKAELKETPEMFSAWLPHVIKAFSK